MKESLITTDPPQLREDEKFLSRWAVALFVGGMIGPLCLAFMGQIFYGDKAFWSAACLGMVIEGLAVFFGVLSRNTRVGRIAIFGGSLVSFIWIAIASAVQFVQSQGPL